jgi:3-oxoacyl-[acyl-carrier-protein] synthase II
MKQRPSIAITGVGLATSLGLSAAETWRRVLENQSKPGAMPALEFIAPPEKGGNQALDLAADYFPDLPREVRYLRWTIQQALNDAEVTEPFPYPLHRMGFVVGTTLHGMRAGGQFFRTGEYAHLRHFLAGSTLDNAISHFPFTGDSVTTCSACSSSLGSIALAITLLETGQLDLVVSGGYDTVSEYAFAGFNSLRLVADGPLRPFCKNRQGMKIGEGFGIVVLERATDAHRRGKKPSAIILGCGESADAHHLTQPHPEGLGAAAAMNGALHRAGIDAKQIDLIAAHATGTPDNDAGEHAALVHIFGADLPRVPVVSFKTHVGHTLGGAGAVELILSSLALRDQTIPACANVAPDDLEFSDLSVVTSHPRPGKIRATLNTSLGFGGANTCAILGPESTAQGLIEPVLDREVFITGVGLVLPGAVGTDAFSKRLNDPAPALLADTGSIPTTEYEHLLNARRIRRMNDYVKLTLAATTLALKDAHIDDLPAFSQQCSALLGTTHGGSSYCVDYYRQIVTGGWVAANPMLFAEGVPNSAAAHLSLMLSLKGACQTVIGSRTAGLDALRLASLRIASGQWDRAIVGAAEEFHSLVNEAYAHCGLHGPRGFAAGAGAVTLILESRSSMQSRGGRARGQLIASASSRFHQANALESAQTILQELNKPPLIFTSANNTWIDRIESEAIARTCSESEVRRLYGRFPELFSAAPLAAVAAGLLDHPSFAVLCTGYNGTMTGVQINAER